MDTEQVSCDEESDTGLIIYEMLYVVGVGLGQTLREPAYCLYDEQK